LLTLSVQALHSRASIGNASTFHNATLHLFASTEYVIAHGPSVLPKLLAVASCGCRVSPDTLHSALTRHTQPRHTTLSPDMPHSAQTRHTQPRHATISLDMPHSAPICHSPERLHGVLMPSLSTCAKYPLSPLFHQRTASKLRAHPRLDTASSSPLYPTLHAPSLPAMHHQIPNCTLSGRLAVRFLYAASTCQRQRRGPPQLASCPGRWWSVHTRGRLHRPC